MSWCKVIGHKWIYSKEDITYINLNKPNSVSVETDVRICNRCDKKQRLNPNGFWTDWSLTLEESRHIKLKNLGL